MLDHVVNIVNGSNNSNSTETRIWIVDLVHMAMVAVELSMHSERDDPPRQDFDTCVSGRFDAN